MAERAVVLTANSASTLSSSSEETRKSIIRAFASLDEHAANTQRSSTGHYISSVGDARVVWKHQNGDRIVVISIFAPPVLSNMSQLQPIEISYEQAATDLEFLRDYLATNQSFSESDVVSKLKRLPHLCGLLGSLIAGVPKANVFKFEFQIQGVFAAEFVVGNTRRQRYVFVEFEDGSENSLFSNTRTVQMRNWSARFEHGFGQLLYRAPARQ